MIKFSNPRTTAEFGDWPIGGANRGQCKFEVEKHDKRGYRVVRTTTNKYGQWCKPKLNTYGGKAAVVDGEDGRTYLLQHVPQYQAVKVETHDFMSYPDGYVWQDRKPSLYAELLALINSAYND